MSPSPMPSELDRPPAAPAAPPRSVRKRLIATAIVHALVIVGGVGWAAVRYRAIDNEKTLPPLLPQPLSITPLYDDPRVVADDQLERVLWKLRPKLRGRNPKINNVDHALRFWGLEARFDDPLCLSGVEMREMLTDHRRLVDVWGDPDTNALAVNSLLVTTLHGVSTHVQKGHSTSSHVDHTVATLAEVGTPPDFPLITPDGETTFQAMLEHARRDFRLNQIEYEWSALVFALYMSDHPRWITREGQWIDFDRLAERIMRQDWTRGVCFGNHRLFTLAALVRVDDMRRAEGSPAILTSPARARIIDHLKQATELLVANQTEEGNWDGNWDGSPANFTTMTVARDRRILATGHALEWWAVAPEDVHPPREVIVRAGQWLVREIDGMSDAQIRSGYTFLTHAGRSLALWRSRSPAEVVAHMSPANREAAEASEKPAQP
ncbi:MAG: hypothetical protein WD066_02670 [Planctomycetaceae bacterium]